MFKASKLCRDQPRLKQLYEWHDQIVVQTTNGFFKIGDDFSLSQICSPGDRPTVGLATSNGHAVALCGTPGQYALCGRGADGWTVAHIASAKDAPSPQLVCGGDYQILVFADHLLWRRGSEPWHETAYPKRKLLPTHLLVHGNHLLLGSDCGEWGGECVSMNIETGEQSLVGPKSKDPVRVLASHNGELWVVRGYAHLHLRKGSVHISSDSDWTCLACCSNVDGSTNWPLEPSSFEALSFSPSGVPHLLVADVGIVRYADAKWEILTQDWPEGMQITSLHMATDALAFVGTSDAGILVINLESKGVRQIPLGWSYYERPARYR